VEDDPSLRRLVLGGIRWRVLKHRNAIAQRERGEAILAALGIRVLDYPDSVVHFGGVVETVEVVRGGRSGRWHLQVLWCGRRGI
jgi:hypothetical protein